MDAPPPTAWTPRRILFLGVVGAVLAASVTAGVRLMNARVDTREAASADERRLEDLQAIVARAQEAYETDKVLPATLDELQARTRGRISVADPVTFEVYEYRLLEPTLLEVCARFDEAASGVPSEHSAGRSCFQVRMG
jgi:hypothetical protein